MEKIGPDPPLDIEKFLDPPLDKIRSALTDNTRQLPKLNLFFFYFWHTFFGQQFFEEMKWNQNQ